MTWCQTGSYTHLEGGPGHGYYDPCEDGEMSGPVHPGRLHGFLRDGLKGLMKQENAEHADAIG